MRDQIDLAIPPSEIVRSSLEGTIEPDPLKGGNVHQWALDQTASIRAGRYQAFDWVYVADEIESVENSELGSLSSHIEVVLTHMLEWDHQPQRRTRSWTCSINEHRQRILDDFADNPSLKFRLQQAIERGYRFGRFVAARETDLPLKALPRESPYGWDEIMDRYFLLDQTSDTE